MALFLHDDQQARDGLIEAVIRRHFFRRRVAGGERRARIGDFSDGVLAFARQALEGSGAVENKVGAMLHGVLHLAPALVDGRPLLQQPVTHTDVLHPRNHQQGGHTDRDESVSHGANFLIGPPRRSPRR